MMSKQFGWMIGLGLLSITLVTVGTTGTTRKAAAADEAPICQAAPSSGRALDTSRVAFQGVGTGGAAGSGPPLIDDMHPSVKQLRAAATPKAPTSTALVFLPLWTRP